MQRGVDRIEAIGRKGKVCDPISQVCKRSEGKENHQVRRIVGEGSGVG